MSQQRSGRTVKVSVSLDRDDLAVLERHAKERFDGNLSAAFADASRLLRQLEARERLFEMLGGSTLTAEARAAIDAEHNGGPRYEPRRVAKKSRHAACGRPRSARVRSSRWSAIASASATSSRVRWRRGS